MARQGKPAPKPQRRRHFIKEWRNYRGLTQEQLAQRIDKTRGLIAQIEGNTTNYTGDTLEAIADALQCQAWDLLNVDPSKEGDVVDITDLLRQASPEQRAEAIGYIRGLVRARN